MNVMLPVVGGAIELSALVRHAVRIGALARTTGALMGVAEGTGLRSRLLLRSRHRLGEHALELLHEMHELHHVHDRTLHILQLWLLRGSVMNARKITLRITAVALVASAAYLTSITGCSSSSNPSIWALPAFSVTGEVATWYVS